MNHETHFGIEHDYMPVIHREDDEWIETIEDDGLGVGD